MTPDQVRRLLLENAHRRAECDTAGRKIREAAAGRLEFVNARLDKIRPRVHTSPDAAEEYQALIVERGRLNTISGTTE